MNITTRTELTLPNDASVLRLARAYVRELATLADLPSDQVEVLVVAADEACTNVIEHAFEPSESGTFTVAGELRPTALTPAIHDRGMPFVAVDEAGAEGFFFSGLGPQFASDGDVLRLQYLNVELDTVRLQVMSPFGRELVEYVTKERERVGQYYSPGVE